MEFNQKFQLSILKLLFIFFLIDNISTVQAQRTFTICPGDEVVLSVFTGPPPPGPAIGPPGPNGSPNGPIHQSFPCDLLENSIEPKGSAIAFNNNSITVAPIFTTNYMITSQFSRSAPVGAGCTPCEPGPEFFNYFTVIVEECESTLCDASEPFIELPWLKDLISEQDQNGTSYYDYIKVYDIEDESYIEVIPELSNSHAQIYTCAGSLFCERRDSLSCQQFNDSNLNNTIYQTNCTSTAGEANPGDNKIDVEISSYIWEPKYLFREQNTNFSFNLRNNGPCHLYETDLIFEVNGAIVGTQQWTGTILPKTSLLVETEFEYKFEPDTDYEVRIWSSNPNGSSDLNFANDTTRTHFYESFESRYAFEIQKFVKPEPISTDGMHTVSISLENRSNTKQAEAIYIYWWVNGEEQEPLIVEDYPYNIEDAITSGQPYRSDTIVLGNYFFETDKDYFIEASVDLPSELREANEPQDKLSYFLMANAATVDLSIHDLISDTEETIIENGIVSLEINKLGNVAVNEFTINWFINNVEQPPVNVTAPNWSSLTQNLSKDEFTRLTLDTINFDKNTDYELRFVLGTSGNLAETSLNNNEFIYSYKAADQQIYEADILIELCKKDSAKLFIEEFSVNTYFPELGPEPSCGFPPPPTFCGTCTINYEEPQWILNGQLVDTTLSITVKPTTNALYNFTANIKQDCTGCLTNEVTGLDNITVGILLVDCEKPISASDNCDFISSRSYSNNNFIYYDSMVLETYDVNGNQLSVDDRYVKFDFDLYGPKLVDLRNNRINQPVIITCLEEITAVEQHQSYTYNVCAGDQIQESLKTPTGLGVAYDAYVCDILKSASAKSPSIESSFTDDCIFNFNVVNNSSVSQENLNYTINAQTINRPDPIALAWNFSFLYEENCEPVANSFFNTYPWLTKFVDPADCLGKSVYVYDAGDYEFIVIKTDLAEILATIEGIVYCISPTGGFSFIELYDESRINDSWACEQGFQGRLSTNKEKHNSIQIFPNPAKENVFINLQELAFKQTVISIYDVEGKQVLQTSSVDAFAGIVQMDVSNLERGIYLVEVQENNKIITEKLLIQ